MSRNKVFGGGGTPSVSGLYEGCQKRLWDPIQSMKCNKEEQLFSIPSKRFPPNCLPREEANLSRCL